MDTLYVILYALAAICFLVAAFVVRNTTVATNANVANVTARINLVALGLLFWVLVPMIKAIDALD